jgi:DNA-directed RNA polymerase specialized sigma subunit
MADLQKTEPTVDDLYKTYKSQPTQDNLSSVVASLHPTINYALSAVGSQNDPVVKSKALVHTAKAIQKYDPSFGASLPTYISSQLKQLSRASRQARSITKIPERVQIEGFKLFQAQKKFEDEHGREPDVLELADYTGMPVKRIEKIRKYSYTMPSESQIPDIETEESEPNFQREAMDYVYHDADYLDRKILEYKTGYGGMPTMEPKHIALKLQLTPSQLSRRSAKLTAKINQIEQTLRQV